MGADGEMAYERAPSRWWLVGIGAAGALLLLLTGLAVLGPDRTWAVPAVACLAPLVVLVVAEGRRPRRVTASETGVSLCSRRSTQHVGWEELRRVRTRQVIGFDHVDLHLERHTGDLLLLPRKTPGGVVEAWRRRVGGGRPDEELPQVWWQSNEEAQTSTVLLVSYAPLLLFNVVIQLSDPPLPWFAAGYLLYLSGLMVAVAKLPRRPVLTADAHALMRRGRRHRDLPWSQVRDVRRKGRYDPQVVVELDSGEEVELVGPDEDVVRGWWRLAVPVQEASPPAP